LTALRRSRFLNRASEPYEPAIQSRKGKSVTNRQAKDEKNDKRVGKRVEMMPKHTEGVAHHHDTVLIFDGENGRTSDDR
jgi:hypothetical protein